MPVGSVVIAGDLLGILESVDGDYSVVKDKTGCKHTVLSNACTEVINPYALSVLLLNKLTKRVGK